MVLRCKDLNAEEKLACTEIHLSTKRPNRCSFFTNFFGPNEWRTFLGDVEDPPHPPEKILYLLNQPCPFEPSKKMHETHFLLWVPDSVNNCPLDWPHLRKLLRFPKKGYPLLIERYEQFMHSKMTPYWLLIKKGVIEGVNGNSSEEVEPLLAKKQEELRREIPSLFNLILAIGVSYVKNGTPLVEDHQSVQTCEAHSVRINDGHKDQPSRLRIETCYYFSQTHLLPSVTLYP